MKFPRLTVFAVSIGCLLVTVAIQMEKPVVRSDEQRPDRLATHFRVIRFLPGTRTAWAAGFDGTVCRTTDAGETWQQQKTGSRARLYGLQVMDADRVWTCGSNGTLLRTDNGGHTWQSVPVPSSLRMVDICFIDDVNGWIAGDSGCVMRTTDGGHSWVHLSTGIDSGFRRIWFGSQSIGYVVGYEGIALRTTDGGVTWKTIKTPDHISFYGAWFHPDGKEFWLVGSCGMILHSTDGGTTCELQPIITTNFLRDVTFDSSGHGLAVGYDVILTYDPVKSAWTRQATPVGLFLQSVGIGVGGQGIAVGRWAAVLRTSDAGTTWIHDTRWFAPDMTSICVHPDGSVLAAGADGWVMIRTPGQTAPWMFESTGARAVLTSAAVDQQGRFWVVGKQRTIRRKLTDGAWMPVQLPVPGDVNHIAFTGSKRGYIVGDCGCLLISDDAGDTWITFSVSAHHDLTSAWIPDDKTGFVIGEEGTVMETRDGGQSWLSHYTGILEDFTACRFESGGRAVVWGYHYALESWSHGHNSSWFDVETESPITAVAPGCRYVGLLNGDILDRKSGFARCVSPDAIQSFCSDASGHTLWGAGRFGRIIRVDIPDTYLSIQTRVSQ
ncbi:hypothetical protein JXA80_10730 [bacterium]|nr:hypothetical protein [candidate division CSSED10-310 bacterium]